MKLKQLLLTTISILLFSSLWYDISSQEINEKPGLGRGSIESQFNYVIYRSEKAEDYKMVKAWWLYKLKSEVLDTLKEFRKYFQDTLSFLSTKETEVDSLLTVLSTAENKLTNANNEKNSIKLLGIKMDKTVYNSIMWLTIIILAVFLVIFISLYKKSNAVTSGTISELNTIKNEYEDHRKRALMMRY